MHEEEEVDEQEQELDQLMWRAENGEEVQAAVDLDPAMLTRTNGEGGGRQSITPGIK